MENTASDQVVLFMDQQQQNQPLESQPSTTRATRTLRRRVSFTKPKARNVELNLPPAYVATIPESDELEPIKPNYSTTDDDDDSDEEEEFEGGTEEGKDRKSRKRKIRWRTVVEWVIFITILTCLISSLTIESLKRSFKWGLELWKWCLMVMVVFSGRLVSGWLMAFVVFLIERNFMLRERVLYFVYGLRKSFQNCVWLALVLLAWTFMFNAKVHKKNKLFKKVFQVLVAVLVGATIWLIKIVLVKVLASSFHVATYFDRMKESVFHHYVLDTLSGPPMDEEAYEVAHRRNLKAWKSMPAAAEARSLEKTKKFGSTRRRVDIEKLRKLSLQSTTSAWSVKRMVNYVRSFGLSTISRTVDECGGTESEITSEWEARNCAKRIFKNVAKPGASRISPPTD